ncbi:MAG: glycosyltransferase family 4 protein [Elusimicrobia bacterium]|nr:glycosyltransferase family 4 protein [Elusimicrobiota bacterium]
MRIVHLDDEPYDSGLTQYAVRAAAGLAGRGHAVEFWGLAGAAPLEAARRAGLETLGFRQPWLELAALRRALEAFKPELMVAHTGSAQTLAAFLCGRSGPAVVRTRGDSRALKRRPGAGLVWSRTRGFIAANRRILKEFDERFSTFGVPGSVVYEGLSDPGPVVPPPGGSAVFGIVARLDPVKGHAVLLEALALAAKKRPELRLTVVGRTENLTARELLERAAVLGIADRVSFEGHVPDAFEYMRRCHAGVVASLGSEAVSRAAVEWMALGRPVIAAAVGCLPEYVSDGVTGRLVPPGDAAALAAALLELGDDPLLRERQGRAARRRWEELFRLETFLDATERAYTDALHPVPSR